MYLADTAHPVDMLDWERFAHDAPYRQVASKPFACASGRHRSEL
jgi:hypothetical protein